MRQAINTISLATALLWIIIIGFSVTALYSITNLGLEFGEGLILPSSNGITLSIPFSIKNGDYYDLSEINVITSITDYDGEIIAVAETFIPLVAKNCNVETAYTISFDSNKIKFIDYTQLFLNDSFFCLNTSIELDFAYFIPIKIYTDTLIPWGAPLHNFSIGKPSVLTHNITHSKLGLPFNFENHAVFDVIGTVRIEIYNDVNQLVTSGKTSVEAPLQKAYAGLIETYTSIDNIAKFTKNGNMKITFETPMFRLNWWTTYD